MGDAFVFDSLNWKRQEPAGNIFDTQAAVILNAMVENVASIEVPTTGSLEALEQAFTQICQAEKIFTQTPRYLV